MRAFNGLEWSIAWRYLRARRKEGGISVIAWYALIGVMLGVATLIVVQAVMIGFREEFTDRILGANAHITVYSQEFDPITEAIEGLPGVIRAAPLIRGQVMASSESRNAGVEVYGQRLEDIQSLPLVAEPESGVGDLASLGEGIAMGGGVARELGVQLGDIIQLISPNGVASPFGGTLPRINEYEVVYIFNVGRFDIDRTRVYLPLEEAQVYFNREGAADEIEVLVDNADEVEKFEQPFYDILGNNAVLWNWKQSQGAILSALDVERRVMFIILSLVVLIAALNIISGLVMLVLGCTFALNIQSIQGVVEWISGGSVWDPTIRMLTEIPARLRWQDVVSAMTMALVLSFAITLIPARNAARLNPVEALRYE